jgi:hypothetical protein
LKKDNAEQSSKQIARIKMIRPEDHGDKNILGKLRGGKIINNGNPINIITLVQAHY